MSSLKAGAFVCAAMQIGQESPTDMMMYYDCSPGTNFNGMFDNRTSAPVWSYWALYSWGKLRSLGTQVKAVSPAGDSDIRVTAARGADGRLGILVSRYNDDDNVTSRKIVSVKLDSGSFDSRVRCHITDDFNMFTEYPVALQADGTLALALEPRSFVMVEF